MCLECVLAQDRKVSSYTNVILSVSIVHKTSSELVLMGIADYVEAFYDSVSLEADSSGHEYGMVLKESTLEFVRQQDKDSARYLFNGFFDVYRLNYHDDKAVVDLLDLLRGFEENAGRLSAKQRDHYVHSANVFVLGLCIYSQNSRFRRAFEKRCSASGYRKHFPSSEEEFLFSWGIASLLHDIGYPVEITHWQLLQFVKFVAEEQALAIHPFISYLDFGKLNSIDIIQQKSPEAHHDAVSEESQRHLRPTDLMAARISELVDVAENQIDDTVNGFLETMQSAGFVDHGFYSALIVLKWYGETLIPDKSSLFFSQIVEAATAIFLHNAYRNVLQQEPYSKGKLHVQSFPLAYLLILCDESQEWSREQYGEASRRNLAIDGSSLSITEDALNLHYETNEGVLRESYGPDKTKLIASMLEMDDLFPKNFTITATTNTERLVEEIKQSQVLPRLLASNIEDLAKEIHAGYNRMQAERNPDKALEYPSWESLPDTLKYSNVRQAQTIVEKLKIIGCYAGELDTNHETHSFSTGELETLARYEHNLGVEERLQNGWTYGPERDACKKTSPYLLPYDDLSEDIKDLDRDTIRNIPSLLESVGLGVFKAY